MESDCENLRKVIVKILSFIKHETAKENLSSDNLWEKKFLVIYFVTASWRNMRGLQTSFKTREIADVHQWKASNFYGTVATT